MIGGDKPKLGPGTTREQLMEKFGELLQKYEEEITEDIIAIMTSYSARIYGKRGGRCKK
jgi:predicted site-specific integrase-resolvase